MHPVFSHTQAGVQIIQELIHLITVIIDDRPLWFCNVNPVLPPLNRIINALPFSVRLIVNHYQVAHIE